MNCECKEPGICPRYKRGMWGREFQICQGINIDPGEAEKYRQAWVHEKKPDYSGLNCPHAGDLVQENGENKVENCKSCRGNVRLKVFSCNHQLQPGKEVTSNYCKTCEYRPKMETKNFILTNYLCPGDVLCMTAALHGLQKANPNKFLIAVDTSCQAIFENNPDIVPLEHARASGFQTMQTHYPLINESDQRAVHFLQGYCDFLAGALNVKVPLLINRPLIYVSEEEKVWLPQVEEITKRKTVYWVINAGHKRDYTTKYWGRENFQKVVDILRGKVFFVQVGKNEHCHAPLKGVLNLVDKTDDRQFIRLCYHAQGGIGGVTFLQHLMAGLEKPYICIMGGREPVQWNSYPRQQLLHTVGLLPCCEKGGCWKSRIVPLEDNDEKNTSLCEAPFMAEEPIPRCMALIRPEEVAEKILLASQLLCR